LVLRLCLVLDQSLLFLLQRLLLVLLKHRVHFWVRSRSYHMPILVKCLNLRNDRRG
jgi:hypothetical protein